jgi:YggT family protein
VGALVQVFAGVLFGLLWLLVLGRIVLSWFDPMARSPLGAFLVRATEPILAPIRRLLPPAGMFDLSSLLALIILGALWRALL